MLGATPRNRRPRSPNARPTRRANARGRSHEMPSRRRRSNPIHPKPTPEPWARCPDRTTHRFVFACARAHGRSTQRGPTPRSMIFSETTPPERMMLRRASAGAGSPVSRLYRRSGGAICAMISTRSPRARSSRVPSKMQFVTLRSFLCPTSHERASNETNPPIRAVSAHRRRSPP